MPIHARADTLGDVQMLDSVRARLRAMDPFRVDIALAALFVIATAIELSLLDSEGHSRAVTLTSGVLAMSGLAFRRRDALLAAALYSAPVLLQGFLDGFLTKNSTTPFVALMLLLYSVGRYAEGRRFAAAASVLTGAMVVTLFIEADFLPGDLVWAALLFGLPLLAGRALHSRALLQAELREKAAQAERDRIEQAHLAVEDERVRIAAELQELVANGLSAMVVQAEAVPRALAAGDSPRAGAALAAVETTGREALAEMRTLLGVLRRDGDAAKLAPQPGLARLEALAERSRESSLAVSLEVEGAPRPLPAGIDLTAYRVIEDALDAAGEQDAGRAEVLVRYTPRELQLQVIDDRVAGDSKRLGRPEGPGRPVRRAPARGRARRGRLPAEGGVTAGRGGLMRHRLRGLSERSWRTLDRLLVACVIVIATVDLATNSKAEGPLGISIAVMIGVALSFWWRRSRPFITVLGTLGGLLVMAIWLTPPPDMFTAVLVLVTAGYAAGRHTTARESKAALALGVTVVVVLSIIFDPSDIFFPVTFFWIIPWLAGRTIRHQTMLARELAEKAERAQHAREEDERRAIAIERSRIARELHDVLAHNLSVMVVQAAAARRVLDKDPARAIDVAALIERTGREALAEIRHLFGPMRRGDGEALSGPPSIARVGGLLRRARAAGLGVELRVLGDPVALPAGVDLTAYRIVQEALTNALKHAGSARASVTVSYEPNELVLSIEDDGEGPRDGYELSDAGSGQGLVGMRERAALYGGLLQAGRRRGGGFAVRARLPTRPLVPGAELSRTGSEGVPA